VSNNNKDTLQITEIYASIQGESLYSGHPCTFIRTTGCPLRCRWCDTTYSFKDGQSMTIDQIVEEVAKHNIDIVELTGGEPLAEKNTLPLMNRLLEKGYHVLIETSGHLPIKEIDKRVHIIMDVKCPGSNMVHKNALDNLNHLKPSDEVKFVLSSKDDFEWARNFIESNNLTRKAQLSLSPAWGLVKPHKLVEWMLDSQPEMKVRLNLQIHKYIWSPKLKGV